MLARHEEVHALLEILRADRRQFLYAHLATCVLVVVRERAYESDVRPNEDMGSHSGASRNSLESRTEIHFANNHGTAVGHDAHIADVRPGETVSQCPRSTPTKTGYSRGSRTGRKIASHFGNSSLDTMKSRHPWKRSEHTVASSIMLIIAVSAMAFTDMKDA